MFSLNHLREMGSSYYEVPNMGTERGSGSSRKSKKNNSERPKQPQRGLGVAQLEKMRLHGQMDCNYFPSPHGQYAGNFAQDEMRVHAPYSSVPSSSMSSPSHGYDQTMLSMVGEYERSNNRYGDSFSSAAASWNNGDIYDSTRYNPQPYHSTRHFLAPSIELNTQQAKKKKHRGVSESSSDGPELDLELRLSL